MQSGRDGQRNLKPVERRNFAANAGVGSQAYNEVLNPADGDVTSNVATTGGQRPDSCDVGECGSCSESPGCTLWRTSEPCTQKMTSSAMLVA